jgi:hypothetical protein
MLVQHWLADAPDEPEGSYQQIACPACAQSHFINTKTGKLLGKRDTGAETEPPDDSVVGDE